MTLQELAKSLGLDFQGPADHPIQGVRDIEALSPEQDLTEHFVYFIESPAVLKRHPKAAERGVVLTSASLAARFPRALVAPDGQTRLALIALLKAFDKAPAFPAGISPKADVHPSAKVAASATVLSGAVVMEGASVGERCVLYPGVVLEPFARLGDDSVLYPNVVLGHHCSVGKSCIVHGGTVIGSDGFGFHDEPGKRHKVPQIGSVEIGDHVELGSGCTIDRAAIETTSIGDHTKVDNQVHIAHNCRVGRFCYIAGNTGLAGSVVAEDGVMISGMVSIRDHVRLAKGTIVMGMSGVAQDTEPKTAYFGTPALPAKQMHKMNASLQRLPELLTRVRALEDKLGVASSSQPSAA